ncbi:MAG: hypothetical protein KGI57_09280 [Hyphomicrobiales bacterium]|nr:hypothetical protein [Hyphomicrobiales bacterium]
MIVLFGAAALAGALGGCATMAGGGAPMDFRVAKVDDGRCSGHCPDVIAARGQIGVDTADRFVAFLKDASADKALRDVVLIDSPGGKVVGAMRLGMAFRKLGAAVVVARVAGGGTDAVAGPGLCMSACAYAFMGGVKRVVPSHSLVGIHRMSRVEYEAGGSAGAAVVAQRVYATPDMVAALTSYARSMGVGEGLVKLAETVPPANIHIVTPDEERRWRLATSKF